MNGHAILGMVAAGLLAAGAAIPGPVGWVVLAVGGAAMYQVNKDKARLVETAVTIARKAIPGLKPPAPPDDGGTPP